MKHVLTPLLTDEECVIRNVPDISSCRKLAEIVTLHGGTVEWMGKNEVRIDAAAVRDAVEIPEELFFHTSGGVLAIPLLVNRTGKCIVENKSGRGDTGGDQIGRPFNLDLYPQVGISVDRSDGRIEFTNAGLSPFKYDAGGKFAPSVIALFSALGKKGRSEISNPIEVEEFGDTLGMLRAMGAEIRTVEGTLVVNGGKKLHGVEWDNLADKNDLVTWVAAALATESAVSITGIPFEKFKLAGLFGVMDRMGVNYRVDKKQGVLGVGQNALARLKPVEVVADLSLGFTSEWQVLLAPVWAQIPGESRVVDGIQPNRMWHWEDLGKLGAKYEYYKDARYPEVGGKRRAVKVKGGARIRGGEVRAGDLRSAAALMIAGMAGMGETKVIDAEDHIKRGYEDFPERAIALGAKVEFLQPS